MSYTQPVNTRPAWILTIGLAHTNERLYESKDSREMLKGSSASIWRWLELVDDECDDVFDFVDQKFLRSVGDGGR